jgi:formylglycine-generating enzyme required for sulfatase activity
MNEQGLPEYTHLKTAIVMVLLPKGRPNSRWASVGDFLIAKHEVTRAEFSRSPDKDPPLPQGGLSWVQCRDFCVKNGLALPTEEQWEYACRAETGRAQDGERPLKERAWYEDNSDGQPHPVGEKRPNDFGLADMLGNMSEWCEDSSGGKSKLRALRGGGYRSAAADCTPDARLTQEATNDAFDEAGFRPVFIPR